MSNGKGDKRRPRFVDKQTYDRNWDRVYTGGHGEQPPTPDGHHHEWHFRDDIKKFVCFGCGQSRSEECMIEMS